MFSICVNGVMLLVLVKTYVFQHYRFLRFLMYVFNVKLHFHKVGQQPRNARFMTDLLFDYVLT